MTNTPDHIRKKIEEEAERRFPLISVGADDFQHPGKYSHNERQLDFRCGYINGASYGYSLAIQEAGEKDKEIEKLRAATHSQLNFGIEVAKEIGRMKRLIGNAFESGELTKNTWQQFKTKHNI